MIRLNGDTYVDPNEIIAIQYVDMGGIPNSKQSCIFLKNGSSMYIDMTPDEIYNLITGPIVIPKSPYETE